MLKFIIDSIDGLEDSIKSLYEPTDDGKYQLAVEGAVSKAKIDEFRTNNIRLTKELEKFKDIDPVKYAEYKKKAETAKTDDDLEELVQNRVKQLTDEHTKTTSELTEKLNTANSQLSHVMIHSEVRSKALEHGVIPTALDDVLLRAGTIFKLIDGVAVPHKDGQPVFGKDGTTHQTVDEWVQNLSKSATHLFDQSKGSGTSKNARNVGQNRNLSANEKIAQGLANR